MKNKVPSFSGKASEYSKWKKLVKMWETICEENDTKKQGVLLIMNMADKASDLLIDETDTSVAIITKKLDSIYESDNDLMDQFDQFYRFRRDKDQTMKEYIHFYESKVAKLKTGGLTIPDLILSYLIIEGAQLSDNDKRIAKATCNNKTMDDSKKALLRLTDSQVDPSISMSDSSKNQIRPIVKEEQEITFYGSHQEEEEILYNRDRRNQRQPFNRDQRNTTYRRECYGCGDLNHMIRDCPHVRELRQRMKGSNNRSDRFNNNSRPRGAYNNYLCSEEIRHEYDDQFYECQQNSADVSGIPIFFQSHIGSEIETILLVDETINQAVLDCGASRTVCGTEWYTVYLDSLPERVREQVTEYPSDTMFRFGVGTMRASKRVLIPVTICKRDIRLEVDVVATDIPLLISLQTMKALGMNIDFETDEAKIDGKSFSLKTTSTGHYALSLAKERDPSYVNNATCEIMIADEVQTGLVEAKKKALKLHKRFAHAGSGRVIKLLKNADMSHKEVERELIALDTSCDYCLKHKRAHPRPTVALPLAYQFNELVTMDLKKINGTWILHCCDYVTRFSSAHVLMSKDSDEVMEKLFECWISVFGPPEKILTDNGGEFVNDKWQSMFAAFNILHKDTASEAPFQNGICERHNDLIGHMTQKVMEDVKCKIEIALMWAIHAKNSLISVLGFSPYQLVFGKNPNIPGNSTNKLPAMSSYTSSQTVANHLNSLRMSREAYIKAENAERVARAMRGRVYAGTHQRFFSGDIVYYKKRDLKQWQGPGKVLGQDGAQVLVKTGARTLIKVHPCKLILKQTAEQQMNSPDQTEVVENDQTNESPEKQTIADNDDSDSDDDEPGPVIPIEPVTEDTASTEHNTIEVDPKENVQTETSETQPTPMEIEATVEQPVITEEFYDAEDSIDEEKDNGISSRLRSRSSTQMTKGDVIYIKNIEFDTWVSCSIIEKDGVAGERWKVANGKGDRFIVDLKLVEWLRTKEAPAKDDDAGLFADVIRDEEIWLSTARPSSNEEEIAMEKEIQQWQKFDVYEEVDRRSFPNQEVLSCRWVINQKEKPEGLHTKARLVIKGFQESNPQVADSPTAGKCVTRTFIMLANMFEYKLLCIDVRAAFLQSKPLDRLILVKPPKEKRTDSNMVWRLKKPVYGLNDAARAWFMTVKEELILYGCVQMPLDKSVFVYQPNGEFSGFLNIHVDDFLGAGNIDFHEKVIKRLKEKFQIGTEEHGDFTYVGWNIKQSGESNNTVTIDQIDYQETTRISPR